MYTHHKLDHEFEGGTKPGRAYMVCAVPRSGSSLLCEGLCLTGLAGAPTEFFDRNLMARFCENWNARTLEEYLDALLSRKTSPNGIFGFKAHWPQFEAFFGDREVRELFPDLRFLYIYRRDRIRQAVSYSKAIKTGKWASHNEARHARPPFDYDHVRGRLEEIVQYENLWERFFESHDISPLRICYEDFEHSYEETVCEALGFVGVEVPEGCRVKPPTLEKQADRLSEQWVREYRLIERYGPTLSSAPFLRKLAWRIGKRISRIRAPREKEDASTAPAFVGFLDQVAEEAKGLRVQGWMLLDDQPAGAVECETQGGERIRADVLMRPDIGEQYKHIEGAEKAGFTALIPGNALSSDRSCSLRIHALQQDRIVFSCDVTYTREPAAFPPPEIPYWMGEGKVDACPI
jgi:LPS sulfotransferase NodH